MARRDELLELLRPPAHRGPLIAAGAVVLTVAIALVELRLDDELPGIVHVLILGLAAALFLGLGLQAEREGGAPAPPQSVLLVCGLLLLWAGLLRLADLLGADFGEFPAATLVWTSLVVAAAAGYAAARCNSAICTMLAGIAAGVAVLCRRELDLRRELGDDVPLAAARPRARLRARLARPARRAPAPRGADGRHGRPGDPGDLPRRGARRAVRRGPAVRRSRRSPACCPASGSSSCSSRAAGWSPTARSTACPAPRGSASPSSRAS